MRPAASDDYVRDFVEEVLRTGLVLSDIVGDLIEALPESAFPGESHAEVVLEMLIGTVRPVADAAGREPVNSATMLLAAARDRTLSDLERAAELAAKMRLLHTGGERRNRRPGSSSCPG